MDAGGNKRKSYLFDLGHPAHVHYFKWHIKKLKEQGSVVTVVARDKDVTHKLLSAYDIHFISRGSGSDKVFGKLIYMLRHIHRHVTEKYGPHDVSVEYASFYIAIAAFFLGKKSIILDDTESGFIQRWLYLPFASRIIVPEVFSASVPKFKTKRLSGVFEELYMSDLNQKEFNISRSKKRCILRLVKWSANHDIGLKGISSKSLMIRMLKDSGYEVFVSSETGNIPEGTVRYSAPVEEFHDFLATCDLYVGESATVASEACAAGVYSIYFDKNGRGYTNYWAREKRLTWLKDFEPIVFQEVLDKSRQSVVRRSINSSVREELSLELL